MSGGRPRSRQSDQEGSVVVSNVSRRYELHVSQGHRLFYWPGPDGKRGACKLHIDDDPAIDAVLIQRMGLDGPGQGPEGPASPRARRALVPWGWMLVLSARIEVVGSLWWQESGLGLVFGPEGPEGPLGWMLVFCVRIEVVGSAS